MLCFFDLMFKVRRPCKGNEQPHQQRCGHGKQSVIEETNGDETENEIRGAPEPNVLMQNVECNDSSDEQDSFHSAVALTLTQITRINQESVYLYLVVFTQWCVMELAAAAGGLDRERNELVSM